jgi:hypothetical protein
MARDPVEIYYLGLDVEGDPVYSCNRENTSFRSDNVADRNWHAFWRCPSNGHLEMVLDMGEAKTGSVPGGGGDVTHLVFFGHNIDTSVNWLGALWLRVNSLDDASWSTGSNQDFISNVSYDSYGTTLDATADRPGLWLCPFEQTATGVGKQYWKVYMTTVKGTTTPPLQLGGFLISPQLKFTVTPNQPRQLGVSYGHDIQKTHSGIQFRFERQKKRRSWNLEWTHLQSADSSAFLTFWDAIRGGLYPFLLKDVDGSLYWVEVDMPRGLQYQETRYLDYRYPLRVVEAL